ncbi:hypothetical protein LINPERPRIM_LOCUS22373, partial [Linum perenne]
SLVFYSRFSWLVSVLDFRLLQSSLRRLLSEAIRVTRKSLRMNLWTNLKPLRNHHISRT